MPKAGQWRSRRGTSSNKFGSVAVENRKKLFVINVQKWPAELVFPKKAEMRQKLSESDIRRQIA